MRNQFWRWPLIGAALSALFWAGWYVLFGSVPEITEIKMTSNWTAELPSALSRWCDIAALAGFGWYAATIRLAVERLIKEYQYQNKSDDIIAGLVFWLVAGLVVIIRTALTKNLTKKYPWEGK